MYKTIFGLAGSLRLSSNIWVGRTILISLLATILLGAVLLKLPFACKIPITFFQALFSATSATCVTGLAIVPFHEFTFVGKLVLLLLIQIGGLGLMTFSFFLTWSFTGGLGVAEQHMAREILNFERIGRIRNFLSTVLLITLAIEFLGTVLLLPAMLQAFDFWPAIFYSFFYAVSAFCNAGIVPNVGGLAVFSQNVAPTVVLSGLVIIGGIGFPVIYELLERLHYLLGFAEVKATPPRLSLHSKVVLVSSAVLILLGTLLVLVGEAPRFWQQGKALNALGHAVFHSIMLRSAGFGFEDLAGFSRATLFASCLFMLIGSSPGSTGGGLKTSTLAAALAGILATLRGNAQATIFGRAVPATQVNKAFAILCMGVASIFLTITLLLMSDPKVKFFGLVFEAISAFSTTGIAIGITQRLSMSGQVILMLAMIAGRIGSLTFIFAFRKPQSKASYRLPEEKIFIG